jgi:3-phenylpropionate/cinnamic acid dioxygenase small subunit
MNLDELAATVQLLQDRIDLTEMMSRYGRALDMKDWDSFTNLFAEDMFTQHSVVGARMDGRDTFIGFLQHTQPKARFIQHFVTNPEVSVHGDTADVSAFILAAHDVPDGETTNQAVFAGGRYEISARRTPDGWRFDKLIVHETWFDHRVPAIYSP